MANELEKFIQDNLDELDSKKPEPDVLERILHQMQPKEKTNPKGILISLRTLRWAAACVLAIICGFILWQFQKQPEPMAVNKKIANPPEIKRPENDTIKKTGIDAVDEDLAARKSTLIADLKVKKLGEFANFSSIESAAGRIAAVSRTAKLKNADNDVVDVLVRILDNDPNTNVRLAALDGLARFYRDDYTRKKLLMSLKKQTNPVVQISLIGLLTRMKESGILSELEKIVENKNTQKTVKDCAYSNMLLLHS